MTSFVIFKKKMARDLQKKGPILKLLDPDLNTGFPIDSLHNLSILSIWQILHPKFWIGCKILGQNILKLGFVYRYDNTITHSETTCQAEPVGTGTSTSPYNVLSSFQVTIP